MCRPVFEKMYFLRANARRSKWFSRKCTGIRFGEWGQRYVPEAEYILNISTAYFFKPCSILIYEGRTYGLLALCKIWVTTRHNSDTSISACGRGILEGKFSRCAGPKNHYPITPSPRIASQSRTSKTVCPHTENFSINKYATLFCVTLCAGWNWPSLSCVMLCRWNWISYP